MPKNNLRTVKNCESDAKLLKMAMPLFMTLEQAVSSTV